MDPPDSALADVPLPERQQVQIDRGALGVTGQTGVERLPASLVRFIGMCELLRVLALVLPWQRGDTTHRTT